jgi:hypothetical protein
MRSNISAGIIAGLIAGVVFGIMMTVMHAPTPDGGSMPMIGMVAQVVGSSSLAVGWLYHLFNSAVIGGLFGWILGTRIGGYGSGAGWGAAYGVLWWVLGGLILMPPGNLSAKDYVLPVARCSRNWLHRRSEVLDYVTNVLREEVLWSPSLKE